LTLLAPGSEGQPGTASFSVRIPAGTAPQMQSLTIALAQRNGSTPTAAVKPVTLQLARNAAGCAQQSDGSTRCTASIAAPAGTDTFTIVTYALPNGTGAIVSTTQATAVITAGGKTLCSQTSSGLVPARAVAP
jgi:hypothetical protein